MPDRSDISPLSITDSKISNEARIAHAKLAKATEGQILVAQSNGKVAAKTSSGDVTLTSNGSTTSSVVTTSDGTTVVTGPQGTKGEKGNKGDTGSQGTVGPSGSDATVTAENVDGALGFSGSTAGLVKRTADNTFALDTATYSTTGHTHDHDALTNFVAAEHINWAAASAGTIHATNYTDTTYTSSDFDHNALTNYAVGQHRVINDSGTSSTELWSANNINYHLGGKEPTISKNTAFNKNFGTGSGDVCQGNDSRLSDARTPTSHTHDHDALTNFVAAEHVNWAAASAGTIHATNYTDTTYTSSDFDHDALTNFVANEHLDWTTDRGSTNIHAGNYTDTTYSVGDGGLTQKNFTTADNTKLDTFKGKYTATVTGDASGTTIFYVTHNLGTYYVVVSVRHPIITGTSATTIDEMFDEDQYTLMDVGHGVAPGVEVATINSMGNVCDNCIAIRFPDAPADGDEYLVTIIG